MNKNIEKIFIGLLWLMMVALATTFWMSIKYGFNILSSAHWAYLSSLQANRAQIKPGFYTSLIFALFIGLIGLYFLIRPHFRKINIKKAEETPEKAQITKPVLSTGPTRPLSPLLNQIKKDESKQQFATAQTPSNTLTQTNKTQLQIQEDPLSEEISNIFNSAGYLIKPCKKIGQMITPAVALGYDQTLWIGASNISATTMLDGIGTIMTIFEDTLGESANDITIRGCIISPLNTENPNPDTVMLFDNIDKFRDFMENNKNVLPPEHDAELFDAVSTYISTVISHIGKQ